MAAGAVSLRKSHDIVISPFCNIVKGQANYQKLATLDNSETIVYGLWDFNQYYTILVRFVTLVIDYNPGYKS